MERDALIAGKGERLARGSGHISDAAEQGEDHNNGRHYCCASRGYIVEHLLMISLSYQTTDSDLPG